MIWGRTKEEERWITTTWNRWFAWYPVRLTDGRMAWLVVVERRWTELEDGGWTGPYGRLDYRPVVQS